MSLVEQAMARLRRDHAEKAKAASASDPLVQDKILSGTEAPGVTVSVPPAPPVTPAKRLPIDLEALRAAGYLPAASKGNQFADHYRQIKRPIIQKALWANPGSTADLRLVMVTSALPGDGKTFTSINLALSLARERDISLLLVDADVPKPKVSSVFALRGERGLMDALVEDRVDVESLVLPTEIRGLSILPAGQASEGATELLASARMTHIAASLTRSNPRRIVLLDAPPLLVSSEAHALAKVAGQIVFVVRAGQTPRHAVLAALGHLDEQKSVGLVLNQAQIGATEGYYGYGAYGAKGDESAPQG